MCNEFVDDVEVVHSPPLKYYRAKYEQMQSAKPYIFTYVRNPYDRLLSFYFHINQIDRKLDIRCSIAAGVNSYLLDKRFPLFVLLVFLTPKFIMDRHLLPQYYILKPDLKRIDFVGKLENIDDTFASIKNRFNLWPLQHINKNKSQSSEIKHYNPFLKFLVYIKYRKDFNLFGYSK